MSPLALFFLVPVYFLGAALFDLALKQGLWSATFAALLLWWLGVEYFVVAIRQSQQRQWLRSRGRLGERVRAMPWAFGQGARRGLVLWTFAALLFWVDSSRMLPRDMTVLGTGLAGALLVLPLFCGILGSAHSASRVGPDPLPPGPLTVAGAARSMGQNAKLVLIIGGVIVGGVLVLALLPSFAVLLIRLF